MLPFSERTQQWISVSMMCILPVVWLRQDAEWQAADRLLRSDAEISSLAKLNGVRKR